LNTIYVKDSVINLDNFNFATLERRRVYREYHEHYETQFLVSVSFCDGDILSIPCGDELEASAIVSKINTLIAAKNKGVKDDRSVNSEDAAHTQL
jgi:hypothetical protein